MKILELAKKVAIESAIVAGKIAKQNFDNDKEIVEKGGNGDLVTNIDHLAEREIVNRILSNFPNHQIISEETGLSGVEGDWLWLVDPLDGTNNYAIGIPLYGVSITLLHNQKPILGVIFDSHLEKVYVAENGGGVTCNGKRISIKKSTQNLNKMTIGWIQGHIVQKNNMEVMNLKCHLDTQFKRVIRLWAPSLLWCMFARGDLDGIVLYNSEGEDLYAGLLMAKEAGAILIDFDGQPIELEKISPEPYIIACHPDHRESFLHIVQSGIKKTI